MTDSVTSSSQDLHLHPDHTLYPSHSPSHMSSSCPPTSMLAERSGFVSMESQNTDYDNNAAIEEEEEGEALEAVPFVEDELADLEDDFVMVDQPSGVEREVTRSPELCPIPAASGDGHVTALSRPGTEGGRGPASSLVNSVVQLSVESEASVTNLLAESHAPVPAEHTHTGEEEGCGPEGSKGEVVLRSKSGSGKHERPLSYKLATDEELSLENLLKEAKVQVLNKDSGDRGSGFDQAGRGFDQAGRGFNELDIPTKDSEKNKKGKKLLGASIKRSTSTVTHSSNAAITLRRTLESSRGVKTQSSRIASSNYSLPTSFTSIADAKDSFMVWTRLDDLVKQELRTGSYPAPLIGCIPPSALKLFVEMNKKDETGEGVANDSVSGHSQSGTNSCGCG